MSALERPLWIDGDVNVDGAAVSAYVAATWPGVDEKEFWKRSRLEVMPNDGTVREWVDLLAKAILADHAARLGISWDELAALSWGDVRSFASAREITVTPESRAALARLREQENTSA